MVQLVCPNCTGTIELDDKKEFGFCSFCGTKVAVENVGSNSPDAVANANQLYELGEYQRAEEIYQKAVKEQPSAYEGWFGLLKIGIEHEDSDVLKCAENAISLAPEDKKTAILAFMQESVTKFLQEETPFWELYEKAFGQEAIHELERGPTDEEQKNIAKSTKSQFARDITSRGWKIGWIAAGLVAIVSTLNIFLVDEEGSTLLGAGMLAAVIILLWLFLSSTKNYAKSLAITVWRDRKTLPIHNEQIKVEKRLEITGAKITSLNVLAQAYSLEGKEKLQKWTGALKQINEIKENRFV